MAFVDQGKKSRIAAAVKTVMPAGWKYSISVRNHSTIVCTISAAPVDLLAVAQTSRDKRAAMTGDESNIIGGYIQANVYHLAESFGADSPLVAIKAALDLGNFDRSDSTTDYFDVGHYVSIDIGRWDRPFVCTAN